MTPQEKLSELFKKLNTTNQPINLGDLLDLQDTLKSPEHEYNIIDLRTKEGRKFKNNMTNTGKEHVNTLHEEIVGGMKQHLLWIDDPQKMLEKTLIELLKSHEEKILEQSFKDIESIIETIFQENTTLSEPLKKKWEAHKRKFGVIR